jgi:hypothetical protein
VEQRVEQRLPICAAIKVLCGLPFLLAERAAPEIADRPGKEAEKP